MTWTFVGCYICYADLDGDEDEIWLADDIDFYMRWNVEKDTVSGAAIIDGEYTELEIWWSDGFTSNEVRLFPYPYTEEAYRLDAILLWGLITKNGKDKYILSMDGYEQYNKLFPEYDTIAITKYAESEIEWVDGWPVPIGGVEAVTEGVHQHEPRTAESGTP